MVVVWGGAAATQTRVLYLIDCRVVKALMREILLYVAHVSLLTVGFMVWAAIWHDMMVELHKPVHASE